MENLKLTKSEETKLRAVAESIANRIVLREEYEIETDDYYADPAYDEVALANELEEVASDLFEGFVDTLTDAQQEHKERLPT